MGDVSGYMQYVETPVVYQPVVANVEAPKKRLLPRLVWSMVWIMLGLVIGFQMFVWSVKNYVAAQPVIIKEVPEYICKE